MIDALPIPNPSTALLAWTVVLAAATIGCVTDLHGRRLPNWLTLGLWLSGLVYATAAGGVAGLGVAIGASVALALPYVLLWIFAGGGAGDAKMLAGIGAWLGFLHGGFALAAIAIAGGLAGMTVCLFAGDIRRTLSRLSFASTGFVGLACGRLTMGEVAAFMPPGDTGRRFPYGVAILLGAASAFVGATSWHA
jgi:prepilin peptidase CpaA